MIGNSGPPRRASSAGTLGIQRLIGSHRAAFMPPDLCRWYLAGRMNFVDSQGLESFAQQFAATALLVEIGDSVTLDHALSQKWIESNIALAVDRPTVVYGSGGGRVSFELALAGMESERRYPRRFAVAFCDTERDAVQALIQLRTTRAKDSIVPR